MNFMEAIKFYLSNNLSEDIQNLLKDASVFTVTDALGRIEFANNKFCEILERDINSVIGKTHELLKSHLHSEMLYKNLWRTIKMGQKWQGILSDKSYRGKLFWLDTTIIPIKDDVENSVKYLSIYNDVTNIQLQKINLIESNINYSKYESIFQSINVRIIVVANSKGNIIEWNQGAELAFGYSKLEILGAPLTILTCQKYTKGNVKELLKAIAKVRNNQNVDAIEMYCSRKNGEQFPVEFALTSFKVDDNCFYCAMMLDITKRKNLESRLKQKTKDLELFLYRSAHDLKAPFLSAKGLLNLLKEENDSNKVEFIVEMLDTTIKRGMDLVESITHASTLSIRKNDSVKIDFNKVISNVLKMLSGARYFNLFKFNIEVDTPRHFNSNPELISSIFQNLIQNAIKYSKLPSKTHIPFVNISVKSFQNKIVIKVCDNGQGITENCIKKVFDLYYRANKEDIPGNGLGLYIVKNIVEDLKGDISVESLENKETCFKIVLPSLI